MQMSRQGCDSVLARNKQPLSTQGESSKPEKCESDNYPSELETIRSPRVTSIFFDSDAETIAKSGNTTNRGPMKLDRSRHGYVKNMKVPSTPRSQEMEQITANIDNISTYEIPDGSLSVPTGLCIIPWENFLKNPRIFNNLFNSCDKQIVYDTEEVNVFVNSPMMMQPTIGKSSGDDKSWVIQAHTYDQLKWIRQWLTEKCSVFAATVTKKKWFRERQKGSCLILMDPQYGIVGEMIYANLTRALDCMRRNRKFSFEVDLNKCIKRWCSRVLDINCEVTGAKLTVTNGEERQGGCMRGKGLRAILCLPVSALQKGIYQVNRSFTYQDLKIDMNNEDITSGIPISKLPSQRKNMLFGKCDYEPIISAKESKISTVGSNPAHSHNDTLIDKTTTRYETKVTKSIENVHIHQPYSHQPSTSRTHNRRNNTKHSCISLERGYNSASRRPKPELTDVNTKRSVSGIGAVEHVPDSESLSDKEQYSERNIDDAIQRNMVNNVSTRGVSKEKTLRYYGDTTDEDSSSEQNSSLDGTICSEFGVIDRYTGVHKQQNNQSQATDTPFTPERRKPFSKQTAKIQHSQSNDSLITLKDGQSGSHRVEGNLNSLQKMTTEYSYSTKSNEYDDPGIFEGLDINSKIYDKIIEHTQTEYHHGIDNPAFKEETQRPLSRRNKNIDEWVFKQDELDKMDTKKERSNSDDFSDRSDVGKRPTSPCGLKHSATSIKRQPSDNMVFKPHPKLKREQIPENTFDDDVYVYSEDEDSQHSTRIIAVSKTEITKEVDTRELPPTTCEGEMKLGDCSDSVSELEDEESSVVIDRKQPRGIGYRRKKGQFSSRHKYLGLNGGTRAKAFSRSNDR